MKTILNIILGVLGLLSKAADWYVRQEDKKAGRNEEKLKNIKRIEEEKRVSKRIIDELNDDERKRLRDKYKRGDNS